VAQTLIRHGLRELLPLGGRLLPVGFTVVHSRWQRRASFRPRPSKSRQKRKPRKTPARLRIGECGLRN